MTGRYEVWQCNRDGHSYVVETYRWRWAADLQAWLCPHGLNYRVKRR